MGEFNVMIADKAYRRKGYGYYTVILVMMWAVRYAKSEGVLREDQEVQHALDQVV